MLVIVNHVVLICEHERLSVKYKCFISTLQFWPLIPHVPLLKARDRCYLFTVIKLYVENILQLACSWSLRLEYVSDCCFFYFGGSDFNL